MSRKYVRRFITYHPGLFQDKNLILAMHPRYRIVMLHDLSRIIVRYRKAKSSDYLVLQLKMIANNLQIDFSEILVLNRINQSLQFNMGRVSFPKTITKE